MLAIAGWAWAPTRVIALVEVKVGNEPWLVATLGPELAKTTWRQWLIDWPATFGTVNISVRATDDTGAVQSNNHVPVAPFFSDVLPSFHISFIYLFISLSNSFIQPLFAVPTSSPSSP